MCIKDTYIYIYIYIYKCIYIYICVYICICGMFSFVVQSKRGPRIVAPWALYNPLWALMGPCGRSPGPLLGQP